MTAASLNELIVNFQALALVLLLCKKEEIAKGAAALFLHIFILTLSTNLPHSVHALQSSKVGYLVNVSIVVKDQRPLLSVDSRKESSEAFVSM